MSEMKCPEYIQTLLDQIVRDNGFNNFSMHTKPGSKQCDGFNSDILSITVANNSSDKKLDIVCKTCNESNSCIFFKREISFYNELMPILAEFQREKNLLENDQFLSYPMCYAAVAHEDRKQYVIIMEDVRVQGFRMLNRDVLTPIENVRFVMREFGKFHGLSIAMKDQRPEQFATIKQTTDIFGIVGDQLMQQILHNHFDCTIKSLKNENHKKIMRDIKEHYSFHLNHCLNGETSDNFLVLSHGKLSFLSTFFR